MKNLKDTVCCIPSVGVQKGGGGQEGGGAFSYQRCTKGYLSLENGIHIGKC